MQRETTLMEGDVALLLEQAKTGDNAVLGQLLGSYQNYLKLLARIEIGRRLQGKVDASDIVQETFLDAHRHFPNFRGQAEAQFVQWLRAILAPAEVEFYRIPMPPSRLHSAMHVSTWNANRRSNSMCWPSMPFPAIRSRCI